MSPLARQVRVERFMLRSRELLIARAAFGPLFADYLEHSRRWVGDPTGLVLQLMRQGLAAAGLYITFRALDENTAWTINFAEPPLNAFITADARTGRVVGRYFLDNVATVDHNRLFVQSVRNAGQPQLSSVEVKGFDMLSIFEQYFDHSEQWPARFFGYENDTFVMLSALPDIDAGWIKSVTPSETVVLCTDPELLALEERTVTFGCQCDTERVHRIVRGLFAGREEDLFKGEPRVEVQCPRCGRAYWMTRTEFDEGSSS
jgi:hypothetical protein